MRLFAAVLLEAAILEAVSREIDELKKYIAPVKWVSRENLHVTLKFYGEIREEKDIQNIKAALKKVIDRTEGFAIEFSGVGGFPDIKRPRVIWVGIKKGGEKLAKIMDDIENKSSGLSKAERANNPHLTIGRVKSKLTRGLNEEVQQSFGSMEVREMVLMESKLGPKGPTYKVLEQYKFKGE